MTPSQLVQIYDAMQYVFNSEPFWLVSISREQFRIMVEHNVGLLSTWIRTGLTADKNAWYNDATSF